MFESGTLRLEMREDSMLLIDNRTGRFILAVSSLPHAFQFQLLVEVLKEMWQEGRNPFMIG